MTTEIIQKGEVTILFVDGRLDTTNAQIFETTLAQFFDQNNLVLKIDLSKLSYISSSGLRCFVTLLKKMKANNNKLTLMNLNKEIRDVFVMTGLINIFVIE